MYRSTSDAPPPRIVVAKTALDGHWRGVLLVAGALRDGGFDVVLLGAATVDEIVAAVRDEDPDLLGLNIGGHVAVAERVVERVRAVRPGLPIVAGGTLPPWACERLGALDVRTFPPGSPVTAIVDAARDLAARAGDAFDTQGRNPT